MMEVVLPKSWKEEFALAATLNRADVLYEEKMHRAALREQERRDEHQEVEEKKEREETQEWEDAALASASHVATVRVRLDEYDTKTVEALMDNREALEAVRHKLEIMRAEAYVLPDGRRVFKTMDGQKVFDEQGVEVPREIVDPSTISDQKTRWEPFKSTKDEIQRLDTDREALIAYQAKLDEARARLDKGDITEKDLKTLEADLAANAPESVRHKLGLDKPESSPTAPKSETPASSLPSGMDDLMRQTGLVKPAPLPQ